MTDTDPAMTAYLSEGRRFKDLSDAALSKVFVFSIEGARNDNHSIETIHDITDSLAELDLRGVRPPWAEASPAMRDIAADLQRTMTPGQKIRAAKQTAPAPPRAGRRMQ